MTELDAHELAHRLAEAEATLAAVLSGQVDAVVDAQSHAPILLSRAQAALSESEARYRQIVEATSDGILKLDDDARIVFVNRRFADMLGYTPRELIGRRAVELASEPARDPFATVTGMRGAVESTLLRCDGSGVAVDVAVTRLLDAPDRPAGYLAVVRDVTERKKLQSQLLVSDRMASLGTLAAGVAHEINNPLAAVIAGLDCVGEALAQGDVAPGLGDALRGPLDDARAAAERVRLIVRDLKLFSRTPTAEATDAVDVRGVIESSLRMAHNEIRHRARLTTDFAALPPIVGNEARLGQVFLNLIVNAAQALPAGEVERHTIALRTRLEGAMVVAEVSDTGAGIAPEILGRIFDPFFTTKAVGVGTGLGLAICQRIVTDMGGALTVQSEVGVGTTFRVTLPATWARAMSVVASPVVAPASGARARILLVDDDPMILRSLVRLLAGQHDLVALTSAREALAKIEGGETFDLIMCDLMMPDMTGMELHRELLRAHPEHARRMLFMTGGAFTANARAFLRETSQPHIEKPFLLPDALRAEIRRVLG